MSTDAVKLACFESLLEVPDVAHRESDTDEIAVAQPQETADTASSGTELADAPRAAVPTVTSADTETADADADIRLAAAIEPARVEEETAAGMESQASPSRETAVPSALGVAKPTASAGRALPAAGRAADSTVDSPAALPEPPASASTALSDDFGREHVANEAPEAEQRVTATVTEVTSDYTKRLVFHFENGQVWRQQEARRFQYPKNRSFDVEIARGVFGDYQLRVGGEGRMTRIKRLQ